MSRTMSKEELIDVITTLYRFEVVLQSSVKGESRQIAEDGMYSVVRMITSLPPEEALENMNIIEEALGKLLSRGIVLNDLDKLSKTFVEEFLSENPQILF